MDAGATSAIAVLDFQGRVVFVSSRKHWQEKLFFQQLSAFHPVIVASDTAKASKLVSKVKACFGARLYEPTHSMTELEKSQLTKEHHPRNKHERDALAAAIKAYHSVQNKLQQVARRAHDAHVGSEKVAHAQELVLKGTRMSDAIGL